MKEIFLFFSLLVFSLISCNDEINKEDDSAKNPVNKEQAKDNPVNDKKVKKYKKTATEIVYVLAVYLYNDGLQYEGSLSEGEQDRLKEDFENIDDSAINISKIDTIAKILSEVNPRLKGSIDLINEEKNKIANINSMESLKDLSKQIKKVLEKKDFRTDSIIKQPRYDLYIENYVDKINSIISKIEKKLRPTTDRSPSNTTPPSIKSEVHKSSIPTWLYSIPTLLFALLIAVFYLIKKMFDSIELLKMKRESDKQKFNDLKYNHDRLYNKVAMINIDTVRDEMYEQMNILARRINDTQSEQVRHVSSAPQAKPKPKIFYAQYPDSTEPLGFKNIQFESNSKMVYRITRIEGNKARFVIQSDENTQQYAIGNHGKILKPVCEYLNQPNSLNKTIKVFREGRLELQNNIWIIVEKLKIKFE